MTARPFAVALVALIVSIAGCVQTRRVESSSVMNMTAAGPSASVDSAATYNERRWTGFGGPGVVR